MYYNTNSEEGSTLNRSRRKASNQSDLILNIFESDPSVEWTAHEMLHHLSAVGIDWPITSVRRAMTNLTKDGKLIKTKNLRKGGYGKLTYTWRLRGINE